MADRRIEPPRRDESQIAEEAARWFEALKTADQQQQASFTAWLRQSSRHVHYFLHTTALDGVLNQVDPHRTFDIQSLIKQGRQNVIPFEVTPVSSQNTNAALRTSGAIPAVRRKAGRRLAFSGIAATLLISGWLAATHLWGWKEFATHIGEQRVLELQDGSVVHLNTKSVLKVRMTEHARDLQLMEGEALFIVERDTHRPFKVHVNNSVIQALGTQFNVHRRLQDTKVSVLEGAIRISNEDKEKTTVHKTGANNGSVTTGAASLSAGEEARIEAGGRIKLERTSDIANAAAWRQRRLIFREDRLSDVIAEFNRYNLSPKIRLEGLDGGTRHYTGTFNSDDPEAFAVVLSEEKYLSVERRQNEIVIRPRQSP